jgi:hypothetical protein
MMTKIETLDGEDWAYQMTPFSETCMFCVYLNSNLTFRSCKVFPGGISREIWMGENDHSKPYPGDHGVSFEPIT